ncbi:hypothetical protein BH18ACT9_BH18ACT9_08120 [soil metagenome]
MTRLHVRKQAAAILAGLLIPSVCFVGAATAAPSKWESYRFPYGPEVTTNFCGVTGLTIQQQGVAVGRERTISHGPDGLPYYFVQERYTDTWTNLGTGETMTTVGAYRGHSLKVTDNGDGTLTVLAQNTGNDASYNADGDIVARSAGVFRFRLLIDHGGTPTDPDDDEVIAFLGVVKKTGLNSDFCETIVGTIG